MEQKLEECAAANLRIMMVRALTSATNTLFRLKHYADNESNRQYLKELCNKVLEEHGCNWNMDETISTNSKGKDYRDVNSWTPVMMQDGTEMYRCNIKKVTFYTDRVPAKGESMQAKFMLQDGTLVKLDKAAKVIAKEAGIYN